MNGNTAERVYSYPSQVTGSGLCLFGVTVFQVSIFFLLFFFIEDGPSLEVTPVPIKLYSTDTVRDHTSVKSASHFTCKDT